MAELTGWAFPVEVDETTGRIKTIEDNENIRQSLQLILQTEQGERKMRPSFGTGLNRFMFENVNLALVKGMADAIGGSISLWEKHAAGVSVAVEESSENKAAVQVSIEYVTDIVPGQLERVEDVIQLNRANR